MNQLSRVVKWMWPYRWRILASLACMAVVSGLTVTTVWLVKPILDQGLFAPAPAGLDPAATSAQSNRVLVRLMLFAGGGFLAMMFKGLFKYGADYLIGYVGQRVIFDLRFSLFKRLQSLSMSFFNEHKTGELLSRIMSDVAAMQVMLGQLFGSAVSAVITILALSGFLIYLNWRLAILALVVFPVAVWPIRSFGRKLRVLSRKNQELYADLSAHIDENLSQMKLVKAYQGEDRETGRMGSKLSEQITIALRALRVQARSTPIMESIGALGFVGLVIYEGWEIHMRGTATGGELGSFLAAVLSLYPQAKNLNGLWNNIQTALGAAERVFALMDEEPAIKEIPHAIVLPRFSDKIEYRNVSFAYREADLVLNELSFSMSRGRKIAFVGPSGSGKTTVADLMLRFYDPVRGGIFLDGTDIRQATLSSLRSQIALVSQEVLLFNTSVRENLMYARPGASREEMEAAAEAAAAHSFISGLHEGYDTLIGERGVKLSGGERQRLSIARAFLKDAPIIILDEATAALDAESEALIQRALENLMANRTVFLIAHRLATVRGADRIFVLDRGRIIDSGVHDELYARGGLYRRLCDLQFNDAVVTPKE